MSELSIFKNITLLLAIPSLVLSTGLVYTYGIECFKVFKSQASNARKFIAASMVTAFLLFLTISLFNIVLRVISGFELSGGHELSIVRSFITQIAVLALTLGFSMSKHN